MGNAVVLGFSEGPSGEGNQLMLPQPSTALGLAEGMLNGAQGTTGQSLSVSYLCIS